MKKFIFVCCLFSIVFLFSFSASAFSFKQDFNTDTNDNVLPSHYYLSSGDLYRNFFQDVKGGSFFPLYITGLSRSSSFPEFFVVRLCSVFDLLDGSNVSVSFDGFSNGGGDDVTIYLGKSLVFDSNFGRYIVGDPHSFNVLQYPISGNSYSFDFTYNMSEFLKDGDGFIYLVFCFPSITDFALLEYSITDNMPVVGGGSGGDAGLQEASSFSDLQYIVDLLKSFFFGGTVTDPDTGQNFSFGEDGSGGIMNFVVYSSGTTNFALWHLLVAVAVIGLGITFVIRLAGNFGRAPDNIAQKLHGDND